MFYFICFVSIFALTLFCFLFSYSFLSCSLYLLATLILAQASWCHGQMLCIKIIKKNIYTFLVLQFVCLGVGNDRLRWLNFSGHYSAAFAARGAASSQLSSKVGGHEDFDFVCGYLWLVICLYSLALTSVFFWFLVFLRLRHGLGTTGSSDVLALIMLLSLWVSRSSVYLVTNKVW